jgi:hypothetical protein
LAAAPDRRAFGESLPSACRCGIRRGDRYSKETRIQALKALDDGKKVRARVTVRAKDAAGNVATRQRVIRIVK